MYITWTSWCTSLIRNVLYLDFLVYKSNYKCTLPGHPGLQVSLYIYITWASWFTSLIINVHYLSILIYNLIINVHYLDILFTSPIIKVHYLGIQVNKSHNTCTLPGHTGLQVSL